MTTVLRAISCAECNVGVGYDTGQRRTAPGGFIRGQTPSAISSHPDIPCFLLLDDPANELSVCAKLGAERILTRNLTF